ncbi:MAG: hypothetical protein Q7J85_05495 [Bacillota bacterium]|nr:hypothetical protein [Bacillota bacterium]
MEQPTWMDQLPGDLQGNEGLTQFATIGDMGKAFIEREGKLAESKTSFDDLTVKLGNSIPKIGDNPTAEETAAYFKAIGRPDDINGYKIQKPELPEGMPYSDAVVDQFKTTAHTLGLTQQQAEGLYKWFMDGSIGAHAVDKETRAANLEKASTGLKNEWGGEYSKNIELMGRAVQKFGGDEFKKYMDDTGMGNDPVLIKTFYNIGKAMSEDTLILGDRGAKDVQRGVDGRPLFDYPASPEMKK